MVVGRYTNNNPFNLNHERNTTNTDIDDYNCAGYALGIYSWYHPEDVKFQWGFPFCLKGQKRKYIKSVIDIVTRDFPDLRVIKSVKDAQPDEYVIAFRVADYDFHFIKRGMNNVWYSKYGGAPIRRLTTEEVFSRAWNNYFGVATYKGKITLFAKKY
jgi:hypothetical protein